MVADTVVSYRSVQGELPDWVAPKSINRPSGMDASETASPKRRADDLKHSRLVADKPGMAVLVNLAVGGGIGAAIVIGSGCSRLAAMTFAAKSAVVDVNNEHVADRGSCSTRTG